GSGGRPHTDERGTPLLGTSITVEMSRIRSSAPLLPLVIRKFIRTARTESGREKLAESAAEAAAESGLRISGSRLPVATNRVSPVDRLRSSRYSKNGLPVAGRIPRASSSGGP